MNKFVYLGLSMLNLSQTIRYEFWYDYVKPKQGEDAKLCYVNANSFIIYVRIEDIDKDIAEDIKTRFKTSDFELYTPLPKGKNKKVIELIKNELGVQIMQEFVRLRGKTYSS